MLSDEVGSGELVPTQLTLKLLLVQVVALQVAVQVALHCNISMNGSKKNKNLLNIYSRFEQRNNLPFSYCSLFSRSFYYNFH